MSLNFIDIQNNGYAGVTFNRPEKLTEQSWELAYNQLVADQNRAILPTVVTNSVEHMAGCLAQMRKLIDSDERYQRMFPAFHIEGPCISPVEGYRGAHPQEHIRPASRDIFEPLIEAAGGAQYVAKVTLAPECDKDLNCTRWLAEQGIIVSAGHTDAPYEVMRDAVDAGLSFYTHLGNGSAKLMDRHDNIIYRAMSLEKIRCAMIPDGHHLPFWVIKNWIKWLGLERCILTTDCVAAAGAPEDYVMEDFEADVDRSGDTPVCRLRGTPYLAGSAITMPLCYRNAIEHIGLSEADAKTLLCDNPAKLIAKWLKD